MSAEFVWVTHHVSVTAWLKAEIGREAPHLTFAFARPGLTTFKVHGKPTTLDVRVPSNFARAFGVSLGRAANADEVARAWQEGAPRFGLGPGPVRLHVFERDIDVPVDEQDPAVRGTRAAQVERALREALPTLWLDEARAQPGDVVVNVIVAHASQPDEPWLVGVHRHDDSHGPWPGGVVHVPPPPEAPSRAWCKAEEALRWADLEPRPGETAVELGSSPGGASYALLCRGLNVFGIDPGLMDPRVLAFKGPHRNRFVHLHQPAADVPRAAIPKQIDWLFNDINLAPMVALRYVERYAALARGQLRGAVITLKINDDGIFQALPRLLERVQKLGPYRLRVTQLPSHRSEVAAILSPR